jgi:glutathione peroxidase
MLQASIVAGIVSIALPLSAMQTPPTAPTPAAGEPAVKDAPKSIYDFTVKDIDGQDVALSKYKGDVLLIVNLASK